MEKLNYEKNYFIKKEISNYKPYYDNPFNQQLYNLINKEKKDGNLLEIGCAFGYFLKYAEKNFETYGIDISNYAISQAKKITNKTKFFIFDIEKDFPKDIANKRFDVIIALDILEHLKKPSLIIKRLNKLLKKKRSFNYKNSEHISYRF